MTNQKTLKTGGTAGGLVWKFFKYIFYIFMIFCSLSFILSFIWILLNSFKTAPDYLKNCFWLPAKWDLPNYGQVLKELKYKGFSLYGMLGNSLILIGINVICNITFPQMAAYTIARFDFKGRKALETVVFVSMMIPTVGNASSQLYFLTRIGLYDNFLGIFLLWSSGLGFAQIILTAFYRGVSSTYAEAAYIDGASEWRVFLSIYYPQSIPLMMISVINGIISVWNDYMTGYLYLPNHPTLALGLQQMQAQFVDFGNDYPVMFAGVVLSVIPIFILFGIFAQKILGSQDLGALK